MIHDEKVEEAILANMAKLYPRHIVSVRYVDMNRYEASAIVHHTYLDIHGKPVRQN